MLAAFARLEPGTRDRRSFHDRLHPDRPGYTLRAGTGNFSPLRPVHYEHDRVITVREAARLQGFADDFVWPDRVLWLQQYRQVGNAVPPSLARRLGEALGAALGWRLNPTGLKDDPAGRLDPNVLTHEERAAMRARGTSRHAAARGQDGGWETLEPIRDGEQLLDVLRQARAAVRLVLHEWRTRRQTRSGVGQRLARLRRGFSSASSVLYGAGDGAPDPRLYISDVRNGALNRRPNRGRGTLLDDKLVFWFALRGLTPNVAPLLGLVDRGRFVPLDGDDARVRPLGEVLREAERVLVVKPTRGAQGRGILIIEPGMRQGGRPGVNGRPSTLETIVRRVGAGQHVVAPFIEQAAYAREIFPAALNTVRVMTMVDVATGRPFIPACVHRFGTSRTAPFDAFFGGGVAAPVDLATGVMGPAVGALPRDGRRDVLDRHPDSGAQIAGVQVPRWRELCDHLLAVADHLRFLPYIGWDVAVTDDGFLINEGNGAPSLGLLQACGPILADERVAVFFRSHRMI
jgi:hypothetical protein